jgi:hypothetical protein
LGNKIIRKRLIWNNKLSIFEKRNNGEQVSFSQGDVKRKTAADNGSFHLLLSRPVAQWRGKALQYCVYTSKRVTVMETVLLRVLLLIVLFILLTGDYTEIFNQILQQGTKSAQAPRDASRTTTKSYPDDDADVTQIDGSLEIQCEFLQTIHYLHNSTLACLNIRLRYKAQPVNVV